MDTLIVDAKEEALDEINDFLTERLEEAGCDSKAQFQIELAVEEIFVNIMSYAYEDPEGQEKAKAQAQDGKDSLWGKVRVCCEMTEDPVTVKIQFLDGGIPFDPLQAEEADTSGKMFMERVGGFGIHLVKETMDGVEYKYENGTNILTIRKQLGTK